MKYSVVIPVYNAEKTLERCLESLCREQYPDAEFLVIDDGSADGSAAICRSFAARDSRIRFFQKENGGVSTARNLGLDQARGEFILFVDSDDYVQPGYFSGLDRLDPQGRYDYLLFSYRRQNGEFADSVVLPAFASAVPEEYEPELGRLYYTKHINAPWNKRCRRSILEQHAIRFHEALPIAEDTLFNLTYLLHCRSLCTSPELLYTVCLENTDSLSRRSLPNRRALLALAGQEAERAVADAPISDGLRTQLRLARNFLLLSDIYSESKQLHLAHLPAAERRRTLKKLCRDFNARRLPLPRGLYCRLLALPVRLRAAFILDLAGRLLAG